MWCRGERYRHVEILPPSEPLAKQKRPSVVPPVSCARHVSASPSGAPGPDTAASPRWLLPIVGIGEDGIDGLSATARTLSVAPKSFRASRHLTLAASLIRGAARAWPSPFDGAADEVVSTRPPRLRAGVGRPFDYGVGAVLVQKIAADEMNVVPRQRRSASRRLGSAGRRRTLLLLSVHGRSLDLIRPHLRPGYARILVLTSDGEGPAAFAKL